MRLSAWITKEDGLVKVKYEQDKAGTVYNAMYTCCYALMHTAPSTHKFPKKTRPATRLQINSNMTHPCQVATLFGYNAVNA